jgi:hypothetical protein
MVEQITPALFLTIITIVVSIAGGWAITRQTAENAQRAAAEAKALADAVQKQLADFKVEAVQRFATDEMLAAVKTEITEAINRLSDRLDRNFEARKSRRFW